MISPETRVGIFVSVGLAIFAVGAVLLGDLQLQRRYRIHILFNDAAGLPDKGPAKIAGVEVGRVESISLAEGTHARVTVWIKRECRLYRNATARIRATGIIGTKFLEIMPGTPDQPRLKDGETIRGQTSPSFDRLFEHLSSLFGGKDGMATLGENLNATIAHLRRVSEALDAAVGLQQTELVELVQNLRDASADLKGLLRDLREVVASRKEDVKESLVRIRSVMERSDRILGMVERGEGALGKLVANKQVGEEVQQTVSSLKQSTEQLRDVLGRFTLIRTYWDFRGRYDPKEKETRVDAGIVIRPRADKFYRLMGHNLGTKDKPEDTIEKRNTITALLGKELGPVTIQAGAIRSRGGVAISLWPLWRQPGWRQRLEMAGEAYDFNRDETRKDRKLEGGRWSIWEDGSG
ncbi:MAG: MCE family protein [Elusimicrobia bacterium]|nr:MCE family protein [Elusimicrobiota bacterium]